MGDEAELVELVAQLNGSVHAAEDAQASLASRGGVALGPLLDAALSFDRYGRLCAITLLQDIGDRRAGPVLISMLDDPDDTVRDWSSQALGDLGVVEAVPVLRRAYEKIKQRGTRLDATEPVSIRTALTQLGARVETVPSRVAELGRNEGVLGRCWNVCDLAEVVDALADADQMVLYFTSWQRWRDRHRWIETPGREIDWSLSWESLVAMTRASALHVASSIAVPEGVSAQVTWIAERDRLPDDQGSS